MSYEVDYTKECKCPCGNGTIKYESESNDWGQTREHISICCPICKDNFKIESKYYCPKPKHDYEVHYLVPVGDMSDEERSSKSIKLDF